MFFDNFSQHMLAWEQNILWLLVALQVYEVYIWKLVPVTRFIHDTITRIALHTYKKLLWSQPDFLLSSKNLFSVNYKLSMIVVVELHCYLKTPNYLCGAQQWWQTGHRVTVESHWALVILRVLSSAETQLETHCPGHWVSSSHLVTGDQLQHPQGKPCVRTGDNNKTAWLLLSQSPMYGLSQAQENWVSSR